MTTIEEWDAWFRGTGDENSIKTWEVVKTVFAGNLAMIER